MSIGILSEQAIEQVDIRLLRINYRFLAQEYQEERNHCEKVMALNRKLQAEKKAIIEHAGLVLATEEIVIDRLSVEIKRADSAENEARESYIATIQRDQLREENKRLRQACQRAIELVKLFGLDTANGITYCGIDEGAEKGRQLEESLLAELRAAVGEEDYNGPAQS